MAEEGSKGLGLESWLLVALIVTVLMSGTVITLVSAGKEVVFSPYEETEEVTLSYQQITDARSSFGGDEGGMGYTIANTMSTPMLVNDWKEPHRTLLIIAGPEKPFDAAEASALHDFVTKKGGKVILASNSSNAQPVADLFGVKYFGDPVVDPYRYYEMQGSDGNPLSPDARRVWAASSLTRNVTEMQDEARQACSEEQVNSRDVDNCRLPVLFHRPTAIQVLEDQDESGRTVSVLAAASTPAFIARADFNPDNIANPVLGDGKTGLIVRMDYPVENVLDTTIGGGQGQIDVTGSIVFVADHSVFANHMWTWEKADTTGKLQCDSPQYEGRDAATCWTTDSQGIDQGDNAWYGNERYFTALVASMMEHDNEELSSTVQRTFSNFNVVFDESRHVAGALTMPFTEAVGAVVLLTSDGLLKWLIGMNLFALLAIAIMVVPEKENWRHVFDLTRFRERPTKLDPSQYQRRTREALLSKVRQLHDLTRDEFARKSPAEIMQMVREPRLVELVSSNRDYSNDELRELIPQIRRWGK
ncbi:MAG: hypothetical protein CBD01_007480 [Euryarchaeota archaeon TMED141]|nr:MAG: hypothetical protein CBD01_007480 [Euryarchaeota archaeon TMED141]